MCCYNVYLSYFAVQFFFRLFVCCCCCCFEWSMFESCFEIKLFYDSIIYLPLLQSNRKMQKNRKPNYIWHKYLSFGNCVKSHEIISELESIFIFQLIALTGRKSTNMYGEDEMGKAGKREK